MCLACSKRCAWPSRRFSTAFRAILVLGEVVLTGGGALLPGIETIAEEVFGLPVRVGMPQSIGGLTEAITQPQYATAIGLVLFGANGHLDSLATSRRGGPVFARVKNWLSDLWN